MRTRPVEGIKRAIDIADDVWEAMRRDLGHAAGRQFRDSPDASPFHRSQLSMRPYCYTERDAPLDGSTARDLAHGPFGRAARRVCARRRRAENGLLQAAVEELLLP